MQDQSNGQEKQAVHCKTARGAVVDPKEHANILNSFFSSVYTVEDNVSIPDIGCREEDMTRIDIQPGDVLLKLQRLRTDKAPGLDGIHPWMLKELAEQLSTPMLQSSSIASTKVKCRSAGERRTWCHYLRRGARRMPQTTGR